MKSWVVFLLLMVPLLASADSYWEGDAVLQRGDAAFESGPYAESNSFAPDTQLMVLNLENGKSTVVIVSQRMQDQSDILVLLSPKAADALGIPPGGIARVRISVIQKAASTEASAAPEGTVSKDSDVNPAAAYPAPSNVAQAPPQSQEQQQAATQAETAQAAQPEAQAQGASAAAEDAEILAEAASRSPQKQLFLPPREDQKFAYKPPAQAQPPAQTAQAAQPAQETPAVSGENAAPSQVPSEVPLAQAQPQGAPQAESNGAAAPSSGGELALSAPETPPEQPAPAQEAAPAETQPVQSPAVQTGQAQVVSSLPRLAGQRNAATFYVQLGAYSTQEVAQGVAASLVQTYPVVVLAPAAGARQIYKLLVGPLNKAESGTLLPVFRFRGFRDAFVRRE
jgi:hypothetical protein